MIRIAVFLSLFILFSCSNDHTIYHSNVSVFKKLIFDINTYFSSLDSQDFEVSQYYTDDFVFHSYPAGNKKGVKTYKTEYLNGLETMKSAGIYLNIGHSIYLPGINQETFEFDGSVRVYYGASLQSDSVVVEFSGYQTINFKNGKIEEIWEWADYGGVANKLTETRD